MTLPPRSLPQYVRESRPASSPRVWMPLAPNTVMGQMGQMGQILLREGPRRGCGVFGAGKVKGDFVFVDPEHLNA